MSETPKFEVIDRRKYKAEEEEREAAHQAPPAEPAATSPAAAASPSASAGPRLVTTEPPHAPAEPHQRDEGADDFAGEAGMPPPPTAEESREQKTAYESSSQRLEDLVRAQNPGVGPQLPMTLDQLIQQFYLSAMIQMGAGAQQGERPRVDILGAKQTIDVLGILAEKTKGNLTAAEDRMLQAALFEARMAFLELTNMITLQGVQAPPPPAPGKR